MQPRHEITLHAHDKRAGLTLADLQRFIDDCYRADIPTTGHPTVTISWRARVQTITCRSEDDPT